MIHPELKTLIEKYCTGTQPTDEQYDEIMDKAITVAADSDEVVRYMQELIDGPTLEEKSAQMEVEEQKVRKDSAVKAKDAKASKTRTQKKRETKNEQDAEDFLDQWAENVLKMKKQQEEEELRASERKQLMKKYGFGGSVIVIIACILAYFCGVSAHWWSPLIIGFLLGGYVTFIWWANCEKWVKGKPWVNGGFIIGLLVGIIAFFTINDLSMILFAVLSMSGVTTLLWWLLKHES